MNRYYMEDKAILKGKLLNAQSLLESGDRLIDFFVTDLVQSSFPVT